MCTYVFVCGKSTELSDDPCHDHDSEVATFETRDSENQGSTLDCDGQPSMVLRLAHEGYDGLERLTIGHHAK